MLSLVVRKKTLGFKRLNMSIVCFLRFSDWGFLFPTSSAGGSKLRAPWTTSGKGPCRVGCVDKPVGSTKPRNFLFAFAQCLFIEKRLAVWKSVALGSFLKSVDLEYDVISVASKFSYLF
jgi:hypothetical protein